MALVAVGIIVIGLDLLRVRRKLCCLGAVTALGAVGVLVLDWMSPDASLWAGMAATDAFAKAFDSVFLVSLAIVAAGSAGSEKSAVFAGEYFGILAFATIGLMLAASATSLLVLYVGIELTTMCLMGLVGFAKTERRSAEASVKLFVVGAVASAVALYGAGIVYGIAGSTEYGRVIEALMGRQGSFPIALWLGVACVVGGLAFKIAAVPFHAWVPDVYQGAPTPVSAFLSTASKAGGIAGLMRFLLVAVGMAGDRWLLIITILSLASMVGGNLMAIAQTNFKRMLAYSGIAQAGYMLVAVAGAWLPGNKLAVASIVMYAFLYAFTNIGGFLLAHAVAERTGSDDIAALRGLHRRAPLLALTALVVLFSLGGIPPLAGFVGKLYLFAAAWDGDQKLLVVVGAFVSVIALYYYLRVALEAYIRDPDDDSPIKVAPPLAAAIALCVVMTVAIGVYPRPWVALGERAATALYGTAGTARKTTAAASGHLEGAHAVSVRP
jgi:NADH-quinone oxidoreductase subunit N